MNKKFSRYVIFLFVLHFVTYNSDVDASAFSFDAPANEFTLKLAQTNLESIQNSTIAWTVGLSTYLALVGYSAYITTNYLIQEEHLVVSKYPYAQAWYDAMAEKYPQAHLDQKKFLQTMRKVSPKVIRWCSTFNHIYFPQDSLKDINAFFKKQSEGIELTDEEKLTLAREEFILLHEAGHIEHSDIVNRFGTMIGAIIGLNGLKLCALYALSQDEKYCNQLLAYNDLFNTFNLYAWIIGMIYLSRSNEFAADTFAYTHGDEDSLKGGISFFASEDIDPLFNVENKKVSPFIPVDSTFGTLMQAWAKHDDEQVLAQQRFIASIPALRWVYDFFNGASHPGPSVRVKNIEKELERRS